jgi:hypothetical protein
MSEQRIRGQEIQIRVVAAGKLERTFTAFENFTWTCNTEIIRKGYLGETSDRADEIYKGQTVEFSFDPESTDALAFIQLIVDRAARRTALSDSQINVSFVAAFPSGKRPKVTITDVKFRDPGWNMANRDSYIGQKMSGQASSRPLISGL